MGDIDCRRNVETWIEIHVCGHSFLTITLKDWLAWSNTRVVSQPDSMPKREEPTDTTCIINHEETECDQSSSDDKPEISTYLDEKIHIPDADNVSLHYAQRSNRVPNQPHYEMECWYWPAWGAPHEAASGELHTLNMGASSEQWDIIQKRKETGYLHVCTWHNWVSYWTGRTFHL